jgi:hypothetical protein
MQTDEDRKRAMNMQLMISVEQTEKYTYDCCFKTVSAGTVGAIENIPAGWLELAGLFAYSEAQWHFSGRSECILKAYGSYALPMHFAPFGHRMFDNSGFISI